MRISKMLAKMVRGRSLLPILVHVDESMLGETSRIFEDEGIKGLKIGGFKMFAGYSTAKIFKELQSAEWVSHMWYDQLISVPEIAGMTAGRFGGPPWSLEGESETPLYRPLKRYYEKKKGERARKKTGKGADPAWWPMFEARKAIGSHITDDHDGTGKGEIIAVIDSDEGRQITSHPQLAHRAKSKSMRRTARGSSCGHGGHVATIAAGSEIELDNGMHVMGVAPKAKVLLVKALYTPGGIGSTSDILKAMEYAMGEEATVINMSLGGVPQGGADDDPFSIAVDEIGDDAIVVCATGNSGPDASTIGTPAIAPRAIAVGATDKEGNVAEFSSRGPTEDGLIKPDVVAPGQEIYSGISYYTALDRVGDPETRGFTPLSGTSMACPIISGQVAVLRQMGIIKTAQDYLRVVNAYAGAKDPIVGWGVPQMKWFLKGVETDG